MKRTFYTLVILSATLNLFSQQETSKPYKDYHLSGYAIQVQFGGNPEKTKLLENEAMTSQEFRFIPITDVNSAYAISILNSKLYHSPEDSLKELEFFSKHIKTTAETVMKGEMIVDKQENFKNRISFYQKFKFADKETKEEYYVTSYLFYHKSNVVRAYVITPIKNDNNKKLTNFFETIVLENGVINENNEDEEIYTVVPIMPQLGDNKEALQEYIQKNSKYPTSTTKTASSKNVFVKAVIEKDGKIKFDTILRGVNKKYDSEAKRIVENMPNWTPGQFENGKTARTYINFPIWFK